MKLFKSIARKFTVINKYRYKLIIFIAVTWTLLDTIYTYTRFKLLNIQSRFYFFEYREGEAILLREISVFIVSIIMGYVLVFNFKRNSRNLPLWFNFLAKTFVLIGLALVMNFLIHMSYSIFISQLSPGRAINDFVQDAFYS